MARYLLVHGCDGTTYGAHDSETTLRSINLRLIEAGYPSIGAAEFAAIRIADLFDDQVQSNRGPSKPAGKVVRQVYNFVTDAARRIRAMETVASAVDGGTGIVVAHSLGSVVAYDALCLLPRHNVSLFLTLGSPLAIPRFVRGRLAAFSVYGRHAWPRALPRWLNFFDYRDPVALCRLRRHFGNGYQIEDRAIDLAPRNPHLLAAYLGSHEVISSLGEALPLGATSPMAVRQVF